MVCLQNELRSVKLDFGDIQVANTMLNMHNWLTNVHILQTGNLPVLQQPTVPHTDQIGNNPLSQALVDQLLLVQEEAGLQCKVAGNKLNISNSNNTQFKSGRDRVAGSDHNRLFVLWHTEHGTPRQCIKPSFQHDIFLQSNLQRHD